jgi:uncharacterized membrane protein YeaQ/YmgE (transglycosylase-associated protein family)
VSILHFILLLLVAGLCGSLGQVIAGFSRGGWLASIALGFIGALVGTWLARLAKLPDLFTLDIDGKPFPVIWSIVGSALFVAVLGLLWRQGRRVA